MTRRPQQDPIFDLQDQIKQLRDLLKNLAERKQVIIPIWNATSIPSGFPDGVTGQFIVGDDDTLYVWKDGVWTSVGGGGSSTTIIRIMPFSINGLLVIADGTLPWEALDAGTITLIHCRVGVAPTGSGLTVRIKKNGSSIGTTTIAAGGFSNSFTPGSPTFVAGDVFTVDVTAIGSGVPGGDLVTQIRIQD